MNFLWKGAIGPGICKSLHLNRSVQRKLNEYQQQNLLNKQRPIYLQSMPLKHLIVNSWNCNL